MSYGTEIQKHVSAVNLPVLLFKFLLLYCVIPPPWQKCKYLLHSFSCTSISQNISPIYLHCSSGNTHKTFYLLDSSMRLTVPARVSSDHAAMPACKHLRWRDKLLGAKHSISSSCSRAGSNSSKILTRHGTVVMRSPPDRQVCSHALCLPQHRNEISLSAARNGTDKTTLCANTRLCLIRCNSLSVRETQECFDSSRVPFTDGRLLVLGVPLRVKREGWDTCRI